MIYHQITPWKNTIAFCIVFDLRNLELEKIHNGLLHFGEHLSLIETKKYTQDKLRKKYGIVFNLFDAYTSLDSLVFSVVCHRSDLAEVCAILKEVIYSWECTEKQF
ncbi:MAG: insulinase family protein, partial [Candidatus Magasanikbacteria bacterium]|nr:insulinase family protein [Candidatus Magasanikbacteria bacterium]